MVVLGLFCGIIVIYCVSIEGVLWVCVGECMRLKTVDMYDVYQLASRALNIGRRVEATCQVNVQAFVTSKNGIKLAPVHVPVT